MADIWAYCDHCGRWYEGGDSLRVVPPCPACASEPSRVTDRPVAPMPR